MIVPRAPQLRSMLKYVGRPLLWLLIYDLVVVVGFNVFHLKWLGLQHIPLALFGSAIGVILGFRNNSSYGRWWEARQLWGSIVNNSRSWGRQVVTVIDCEDPADNSEMLALRHGLIYRQIAYVHALRQHLRGLSPWDDLAPFLPPEEIEALRPSKNVPLALQVTMGEMLHQARRRNWIDPLHWTQMDGSLNDLADAQGGTERIKNTPMPRQYDSFPQLFTQMYCLMLPLALVTNMGWYTPLGSTLVGFIFIALNRIGKDLEDPFDNTIFDVPMTAITKGIEINLRQVLGEMEIPQAEKAVEGVLW